jgi:hypothetical protein
MTWYFDGIIDLIFLFLKGTPTQITRSFFLIPVPDRVLPRILAAVAVNTA